MNGATISTSNPSGAQSVCPTGWHLPSDAEWIDLTDYLGSDNVAGIKLKETGTTYWNSPNTGATNETGFTALPGGARSTNGLFHVIGDQGAWWGSMEDDSLAACARGMDCNSSDVFRLHNDKELGFSVRCVRDY